MKRIETSLPGVVLFELAVHTDSRGRFFELYQRDRYRQLGLEAEFVQDNVVASVQGVLRGLHYQLARPQGKLVTVTRGTIFDVALDIRRGSPTFGRWFGTTLSESEPRQLWIPAGFAHGYLALSPHTDVHYKVTAPYVPGDEHAIRWNDPDAGIAWPIAGEPTLSQRDLAAPLLRDATLPSFVP